MLVRSTIPREVVRRHGVKGGAGLCQQTQKSGKDEGDQRTGTVSIPFGPVLGCHASVPTSQREIHSRENVLELETAVSRSAGAFGSVSVFRERSYVQRQLLSC